MTTTPKLKPDWAGQDWLAKLVNVLIQTKPIYALMKQQARQVLIKTAEKNGVTWRQHVEALESAPLKPQLTAIAAAITDANLQYPNYYRVPFHAYDAGNLCWLAAAEAEPATYSMALRVWPDAGLSGSAAHDRLRQSFHDVLADRGPQSVQNILDIGCSVGLSTRSLHRFYAQRQPETKIQTIGFDLSPYMLSVAKLRDPTAEIQWQHGCAEATGFDDRTFDLVSLQFVVHELPQQATAEIFVEIFRILRSGGCVAIVDNNPQSSVIQNLPPILFTLMKSTEPWSDEYYTFDLEAALAMAGFTHISTTPSDPRHRTIVATKP
jgi:ubiquinone/menaquinone biosynthesis C-methylase UbiE